MDCTGCNEVQKRSKHCTSSTALQLVQQGTVQIFVLSSGNPEKKIELLYNYHAYSARS
jgi:hypothetical protein